MASGCDDCLRNRYVVAIFCFFGMMITVGYRVNFALVVAHISVKNNSSGNGSSGGAAEDSLFSNCTTIGTSKDRKVHWSESTLDLFHMSYFAGQFVMSIPAGAMANKYSPSYMLGWTLLITSVLHLVLSVASTVHVALIFVIRIVQGMVEATSVPAMNAVISAVAKKSERARLINIAYAGVYLAPAVANFTTGACTCYISWDSILYIYGSVGAAWCLLWLGYSFALSRANTAVNVGERSHLLGGQQSRPAAPAAPVSQNGRLPWKSFFTSMPVLAVWVASFCRNLVFAMLITEVQLYYKDVYNLSSMLNGLLSAVPHVFMVVFMLLGSCFFDMLIKREFLSVTKTRKLAQFLGFGVQGVCVLAIGFVSDHVLAFVLFCVGVAFSAFAISGFQTNPLDLAPQYAAALTGIVRTGMLGSVVSTLLASQLPGKTPTLRNWQDLFIIIGSIHIAGVIFYTVFASGSLQSWARPEQKIDVQENRQIQQNGSTHRRNNAKDQDNDVQANNENIY